MVNTCLYYHSLFSCEYERFCTENFELNEFDLTAVVLAQRIRLYGIAK